MPGYGTHRFGRESKYHYHFRDVQVLENKDEVNSSKTKKKQNLHNFLFGRCLKKLINILKIKGEIRINHTINRNLFT